MEEVWKVYKKDFIPKDYYFLMECKIKNDVTTIELEGRHCKLTFEFINITALRFCDEGKRLRTYNEVEEILSYYKKRFIGRPVFKVENSEFCKWIASESVDFIPESYHFAFVTEEEIIDVVSLDPPKILIDNYNFTDTE